MRLTALALLLVGVLCAPAGAAPLPAGLGPTEPALVAEVIDGDTLRLADGRTVRLAAIRAPKQPPDRRAARLSHDIADAARAALAALIDRRTVGLAHEAVREDRYGRLVAHVVDADGRWIQAELVASGFARVDGTVEDRRAVALLLGHESAARAARRGLWRLAAYRVVRAEETARLVDSFQIVEGAVRRVDRKGSRIWLDFGDDWRRDFSVLVPAPVARMFARDGLDPVPPAGTMVRVRGWIEWHNGPLIELEFPEQIEVIR